MAAVHTLSITPVRVTDGDWMDEANCKGHTSLFFPPKAERPQARARREARARRLCSSCPVLDECRTFARNRLQPQGFPCAASPPFLLPP